MPANVPLSPPEMVPLSKLMTSAAAVLRKSRVSNPAPPSKTSLPPLPLRVSLPPKPLIVSLPDVPASESLPAVPLMIATGRLLSRSNTPSVDAPHSTVDSPSSSDHGDIGCRKGGNRGERRDLLRRAAPATVCVVVKRASGGVVYHAISDVVSGRRAGCGKEASIARGEVAERAD